MNEIQDSSLFQLANSANYPSSPTRIYMNLQYLLHNNDSDTGNDTGATDWKAFMGDPRKSFTSFRPRIINDMLSAAVILCDILGCLCIILNLFIICIIIRHRKRVLRNVFYVMVFHCAVVDLLRGCCLIIWGLPHVVISNRTAIHDRLLILKINQFTIVTLRSCNLLTIFNLLIFTCNEFVVIRYPLFYRRHSRRPIVLVCLLFSWLISLLFGVGSVFSNSFESAHSVVVARNGADDARNGTSFVNSTRHRVTRRTTVMSVNMLSLLMIFFLCYLSLLVVLLCYGSIMRTIRRLRGENLLDKDSSQSLSSKRIISMRKPVERNDSSQSFTSDINNTKGRRRWKTDLMSRHKYLIVIGTVLFVDILFLFPYSGMQLVAVLHLSNVLITPFRSAVIRWSLQILIGMHAVCQPLCYFRMTEFRRLACTSRKNKLRSINSHHYSHYSTTGTRPESIRLHHRQPVINKAVGFRKKRSLTITLVPPERDIDFRNKSVQFDIDCRGNISRNGNMAIWRCTLPRLLGLSASCSGCYAKCSQFSRSVCSDQLVPSFNFPSSLGSQSLLRSRPSSHLLPSG